MVSFSKTLKFKGEQLDTLFIALMPCRFADQTDVRWSTLRRATEKVRTLTVPLLAPPPPPDAPADMPVGTAYDVPAN